MKNLLIKGTPLSKAKKALILLHGRGSSASRIYMQLRDLCDESFYILIPNAPDHAWYPESFMEEEERNEPYLSQSIQTVNQLIEDTSQHIPKSSIYLIGFSQGACLALEAAARSAARYGGIIAFSGGLIGKKLDLKKYHGNFKGTVIYLAASKLDPYVAFSRVKKSKELLEDLGAKVLLHSYPGMTHKIYQEDIDWVKENLLHISERS